MGWNVWQFQEKLNNCILSIYEKLQSKSIEKYNKTLTSDKINLQKSAIHYLFLHNLSNTFFKVCLKNIDLKETCHIVLKFLCHNNF